jgi:cytochrome c biogenesis protein CcdA/thiol-disulfide isomerase/thioredoxin
LGIDLVNIGLAFLEGLALIISPCILPILPIILSTSIEGNRKRPYGVIVGFIVSFTLFTLFSRQLVIWFNFDLDVIRYTSFALLIMFGLIMVSTYLTEKFTEFTQVFANLGLRATQQDTGTDFASGFVFGILIGLIWTPCAGPILAAVIVQTILQHTNIGSFLTILAFGIGAAIPMLIIILFGRALTHKIKFLQQHSIIIRKIFGVIIILAVLLMAFDNNFFASMPTVEIKHQSSGMDLQDGLMKPFAAPDFQDITAWINSQPLHIEQLRGKVVLIDFWAYSCINCIRTLPYLRDWYSKYRDQGFEIVGVHSPEFDFERDLNNVERAVKQDQILYPIALDNNFATWTAYHNQYWPAHYLIDKHGNVVYEHFGEGDYDVTENNIRYLLGLQTPVQAANTPELGVQTPETYLGYARDQEYSSKESILNDQMQTYSYPAHLGENEWALQGQWIIAAQKITNVSNDASIKIKFLGKKVFAVMSANKPVQITVKLNGEIVHAGQGEDVKNGIVEVSNANLYRLLSLSEANGGELELIVHTPGLELYTFTFGS